MPHNRVNRAKMILMSAEAMAVKKIAENLDTYPNKIIQWRKRFFNEGIDGLKDRPRSGRPSKHIKPLKEKVFELLNKKPPNGLARWDGPSLANELNVSVH